MMSRDGKVNVIDEVELMSHITMRVKFIRAREMRIRLQIAVWLIKLASWVTGMGLVFDEDEDNANNN